MGAQAVGRVRLAVTMCTLLSISIASGVASSVAGAYSPFALAAMGMAVLAVGAWLLASVGVVSPQMGRGHGLALAMLGVVMVLAAWDLLGFIAGFRVNRVNILYGSFTALVDMLWLTGCAAVASAAASAGMERSGFIAAAAGFVAPRFTVAKLLFILSGFYAVNALLELVIRDVIQWILAAAAVVVLASIWGPAGVIYVVLALIVPLYLVPIMPSIYQPLLWLILSLVHLAVVFASSEEPGASPRRNIAWAAVFAAFVLAIALAPLRGYYFFTVATGSMEPSLSPGDVVIVARASASSLSPGDVVAWYDTERHAVVIHRLVRLMNAGGTYIFVTKGDANNAPDTPFTEEQLIGRMVARIPYVGLPLVKLAPVLGSAAPLAVALAALLSIGVYQVLREARRSVHELYT